MSNTIGLEIINQINDGNIVPTYSQMQETLRISEEIISNLDQAAINELMSGSDKDLENMIKTIQSETFNVLFGQRGLVKESSTQYLQALHQNMEETLRIENLNYFLTSLFPEFDVNWHHLEWGEMGMKYNKLNIIAARDHGKSYYWSNIFPIWKLYRYKSKKSFIGEPRKDLYLCERGALITNDADLGVELMEILKNTIEDNPYLSEKLMPKNKSTNWANTKIKCLNGATLKSKSYGSRFRGRHPGWIIVDDFLDDRQLYSKEQRDKAINHFHSVIMNALLKNGQIVVTGTPFHDSDLYGDLKKKKGWRVFEYPSVYPDGSVLWPERYNLSELLEKRDDQGSLAFTREHLVKPVVSDSSIFPRNMIERAFLGMEKYKLVRNRESFPIKFDFVVTACDFAMSSKVGADYSVFQTWGIDRNNVMWLIGHWRGKGKSFTEQLAIMKGIHRNFKPDVMFLENNQFQQIFVETSQKQGLPVMAHTTTTNKHDFQRGLPSLGIYFERDKIRIPYGDTHSIDTAELIASELGAVAWTDKGLRGVGEHDDEAMCMWIATCAARHVVSGFGATFL